MPLQDDVDSTQNEAWTGKPIEPELTRASSVNVPMPDIDLSFETTRREKQCILVCGGRDYADKRSLYMVLDAAHSANPIDCLIHGAARGADTLAADWALDRGVLCQAYPADWENDGRSAGPIRNQRMLNSSKPHLVIAFPGGRGTADMIKRAEASKVPVVRITHASNVERSDLAAFISRQMERGGVVKMDWQPIETAPKDGTHILAYDPEGLHGPVYAVVNWYVYKGETFKETETEGLYRKENYEHEWWDGASYTPFRATHWIPLPAPPRS